MLPVPSTPRRLDTVGLGHALEPRRACPLPLVLQSSLRLQLQQVTQCFLQGDELSLALRALVIAVSNVDGARLGLLDTNHCPSIVSKRP